MPDIFLSYARRDRAVASRFAEGMCREGFDVWWDQTLTAGEAFDKVTEVALEQARAVVVLWSGVFMLVCLGTTWWMLTTGWRLKK